MILYLGDKEFYEFILGITREISQELSVAEADRIVVSEYSHNAIALVREAEERHIPLLAVLDGYRSVAEAFGAECINIENCPEGKQELAVIDTSMPLYKGFGKVTSICRGNSVAVDEDTMPPELDCIARAETGEIITLCKKEENNNPQIYAVNYYLNSTLTEKGELILKNFFGADYSEKDGEINE